MPSCRRPWPRPARAPTKRSDVTAQGGVVVSSGSLEGKRVVLVVTGGIAAYKTCEVVRRLRDHGVEVRVAMTAAATRFVAPLTFAALSGHRVITSLFESERPEEIPHVRWAEWADLFCVAPATADFVAKMAHGVADDFPSTLYLANAAPTLVAPAMEDDMYGHPAVQRNLATLTGDGVAIVGPATGSLASGRTGPGRMSEPDEIVAAALRVLGHGVIAADLEGQHVVITAGPTYEALDPVRGFTNRSSGRMGFALAREALWRGARVTLVAGPTPLVPPAGVECQRVQSAAEMSEAVQAVAASADVAILCAAVCDFTPVDPADAKLKKGNRDRLDVAMVRAVDILAALGASDSRPFLVGFAAESSDVRSSAAEKMERKNCDMIVGNRVGESDVGMGGRDNEVVILDRQGGEEHVARMPKAEVATRIWNSIARYREQTNR